MQTSMFNRDLLEGTQIYRLERRHMKSSSSNKLECNEKSLKVFEAINCLKQRMSLKHQQQKLKAPITLNQRKLFLCFLSIHWEKQKQQGLPQLKEMRDQ